MNFVFIYENRKMKPAEVALRRGQRGKRESDGGGKSNQGILKHICKHHNVSPCTTIIC
jgi:hypothetical protein